MDSVEEAQALSDAMSTLLKDYPDWALVIATDQGGNLMASSHKGIETMVQVAINVVKNVEPAFDAPLREPCEAPLSGVGCTVEGCTHGL